MCAFTECALWPRATAGLADGVRQDQHEDARQTEAAASPPASTAAAAAAGRSVVNVVISLDSSSGIYQPIHRSYVPLAKMQCQD